jgi:hypothetical protein
MICKLLGYFAAAFAARYASQRLRVASAICSRPSALILRLAFLAAFFAGGVPVAPFAAAQRFR